MMLNQFYDKNPTNLLKTNKENCAYIKSTFNETEDLVVNDVTYETHRCKLIYLHTVADTKKVQQLLDTFVKTEEKDKTSGIVSKKTNNLQEILSSIIDGKAILLVEDRKEAYIFDTPIETHRAIEQPDTEKTVRGSHVGFNEDLNTNIYLLRSRIKNKELKVKYITLGFETNRNVVIVYMNHLANKDLVAEVEKRIKDISVDTIFAPGYIEECIEDHPFSPFPQNLYTERPDRVEAHLMEGRVAILDDGSSDAIILPVTFFSFFQSPDDYNSRTYTSTVFRLLRLFSFLGTLLLPPLYIALVGFHFEMIPYELITLVKGSISGVPFSPFFEALFMAVTVELIREAGIRLPTPIGETIGIVGGLIIGDAIVKAGLVSNMMVIVIALTAIMSFTIASYEMSNTVRILNLPIMIAASFFGFVGIVLSTLLIVIHLCKLETFKISYLSPLAPLQIRELADSIVRLPVWLLNRRPKSLRAKQEKRQGRSREWDGG